MEEQNNKIPISEMALMHCISRQTLIHYDKIGLFKPEIVEENGYRFYSLKQIPLLREICFLRNLQVSTDDIKEHLAHRTPESIISFLNGQITSFDDEIRRLTHIKQQFQNRLAQYKPYLEYQIIKQKPAIHHFIERKVLFVPFHPNMNKEKLHDTIMQAWRLMHSYGYQMSNGFGTVIHYKSLFKDNYLDHAGSYIVLPKDAPETGLGNVLTMPAGDYVTMFKYGMPYESKPLIELLNWMEKEGFTPCGDALDACIFDTTFYDNKVQKDFCQLQIPIKYDSDK